MFSFSLFLYYIRDVNVWYQYISYTNLYNIVGRGSIGLGNMCEKKQLRPGVPKLQPLRNSKDGTEKSALKHKMLVV